MNECHGLDIHNLMAKTHGSKHDNKIVTNSKINEQLSAFHSLTPSWYTLSIQKKTQWLIRVMEAAYGGTQVHESTPLVLRLQFINITSNTSSSSDQEDNHRTQPFPTGTKNLLRNLRGGCNTHR